MSFRQPIVVVLGHVDHGKTSLLDKIRGTTVAAREPGAISQHIGASFVPTEVIKNVCSDLLETFKIKIDIPGLLFIDTPGHSAFSNLRRRGGSAADIAILVVDLLEGFKPQTVESLEILKARRTPFVVAANKLDLVPGWRSHPNKPFLHSLKKAEPSTLRILDEKIYSIVGSLSNYNINSERFDRVKDFSKIVAIVPISAKTGEGIPDLLSILAGLTQQYLRQHLTAMSTEARGAVLEVTEDPGLGANINAIIYDGVLRQNDMLVLAGKTGSLAVRVRTILVPKPLDEIRDPREKFKELKEVQAASGVKIVATGLEDTLSGSPLYATSDQNLVDVLKKRVQTEIEEIKISTDKLGLVLKADTLGSLEAIINELRAKAVSIRIADIGDISKRDIVEADTVRSSEAELGVVLGFNVKVLPDAGEEASKTGIKILTNNIIYQLLDDYQMWMKQLREAEALKSLESIVRPGKIKIILGLVFRRNNPAIVGVEVQAGRIKAQYPVIRIDGTEVGKVFQIQDKGENIREATKGMQVAISMKEPTIGRQIKENDVLYVDVPENHVKILLQKHKELLDKDELDCLSEFVEVKRKGIPYFAFGA